MQRSCYCRALLTLLADFPSSFLLKSSLKWGLMHFTKKDKLSRAFQHWWTVVRLSCLGEISEQKNYFINLISHSARWMALARAVWRGTKPRNNVWRGHLIDSLQNGISQNPSGSTSHLRVPQVLFSFKSKQAVPNTGNLHRWAEPPTLTSASVESAANTGTRGMGGFVLSNGKSHSHQIKCKNLVVLAVQSLLKGM